MNPVQDDSTYNRSTGSQPDHLDAVDLYEDGSSTAPLTAPLEIEGEANVISDADSKKTASQSSTSHQPTMQHTDPDIVDDVILVRLDQRSQHVAPGESITFTLTLLNNGTKSASFSVRLEGRLPESWITVTPTHTWLAQGEGHRFEITIAPPSLPQALASTSKNAIDALAAGVRPFRITVLSPEHPQRKSQPVAEVFLLPVVRWRVGPLRPRQLRSTWQNQSTTTIVPISNTGNTPAHFAIEGRSKSLHRNRSCQFEFMAYGAATQMLGQTTLRLEPMQTFHMHVRITPRKRVLLGLGTENLPFSIGVWPIATAQRDVAPPNATQQVETTLGHVKRTPLIGAKAAALAAASILCAILAVGVIGLAILTAMLPVLRPAPLSPASVIVSASEQPPLEIIVKVAEPVPSPQSLEVVPSTERAKLTVADALIAAQTATQAVNREAEIQSLERPPLILEESDIALNDNAETDTVETDRATSQIAEAPNTQTQPAPELQPIKYVNGVPVVQPAMITAPDLATDDSGERVAVNPQQNIAPQGGLFTPSNRPASAAPVRQNGAPTYEQMFKEVARSLDMDWRILAAQAYVESGFDPLATGTKNDMGLMQILPTTWTEWAPRTGATDPYNSYHNLSVAAVYSDHLREIFTAQGFTDPKWRLVAYNWGPNRLRNFLNEGRKWDELPEGRKKYAQDILRIAASLPLK